MKNKKINKKGLSMVWAFIIGMGLLGLLILVIYIFLGDSGSALKTMITKIFG